MKPRLSQRLQFSLVYVLVAAVILSLLQSWLLAPRSVELPMSQFLELLRAGQDREGRAHRARDPRSGQAGRAARSPAGPRRPPAPDAGLRRRGPHVHRHAHSRGRRPAPHRRPREAQGRVRRPHRDDLLEGSPLRLGDPPGRHDRHLDVHHAAGRRGPHPGPLVWALEAQDLRPQGAQDHVRRRGRRGRGQGRAGGGRRLPQEPPKVPAPRRAAPQGRAPRGPPGHRQDAARARRGGRGRRALLHPVRLGVRGDVRGRGRLPGAGPLRAGQGQGALHHLHRRAGRHRQVARRAPAASSAATTSASRP